MYMYMYVLGCPLGLGLAVEGKPIEFSHIWYGYTTDVIAERISARHWIADSGRKIGS